MIGYAAIMILFIITVTISVKKICYILLESDKINKMRNTSTFNKGGNV